MKTNWLFSLLWYLAGVLCFVSIYGVVSSISSHTCRHIYLVTAVSLTLIIAFFVAGYWLQRKMAVLFAMVLIVLFILELLKADLLHW